MIDLDREEFLARLDIRIAAITSALAYHEKYLITDLPKKEFIEAEKVIDRTNLRFNEMIKENDRIIREQLEKLKADIAKEDCKNE